MMTHIFNMILMTIIIDLSESSQILTYLLVLTLLYYLASCNILFWTYLPQYVFIFWITIVISIIQIFIGRWYILRYRVKLLISSSYRAMNLTLTFLWIFSLQIFCITVSSFIYTLLIHLHDRLSIKYHRCRSI